MSNNDFGWCCTRPDATAEFAKANLLLFADDELADEEEEQMVVAEEEDEEAVDDELGGARFNPFCL